MLTKIPSSAICGASAFCKCSSVTPKLSELVSASKIADDASEEAGESGTGWVGTCEANSEVMVKNARRERLTKQSKVKQSNA